MPYYKVQDILVLVRKFHQDMQEVLAQIQQDSDASTVEWLSDQIRHYELHWQAALADYEKHGTQGVLDTWLQFVPDDPIRKEVDSISVRPEMTLADLTEINMRFRNSLIDLYQTLATASAAPHVQEFFQQLLKQEQAIAANQSLKSRASSLVESDSPKTRE